MLLNAFSGTRIKASESDLMIMLEYLAQPGESHADFWDFWDLLLPTLSDKAIEIIGYLWNTLNASKDPEINLSKMKNRFFGKFDPDVQSHKRQERQVENEFIRYLDTYCQVGLTGVGKISKQEFMGFMKCWNFACEDEGRFLTKLVECFRLSEYTREFGIGASKNRTGGSGWRKEWGTQSSRSSRFDSQLEESKGSMWGNFTQGKEEIKHSRRGRSTYAFGKKNVHG
jgi:hypothetical protein